MSPGAPTKPQMSKKLEEFRNALEQAEIVLHDANFVLKYKKDKFGTKVDLTIARGLRDSLTKHLTEVLEISKAFKAMLPKMKL